MLRRHQTITSQDSGTPAGSFEECLTPTTPTAEYHYGTPPPAPRFVMPHPDTHFLRPPTPFEAGLTKFELPPHRRVIIRGVLLQTFLSL